MATAKTKRKGLSGGSKRGDHRPGTVYRLKIELPYIKPAIWRRVEVPGSFTFDDLHDVIQVAMGWEDDHLWGFYVGKTEISPESERIDFPGITPALPAHSTTLEAAVCGRRITFRYVYDMGDSWRHDIKVEEVCAPAAETAYPRCTGGARACPPEDCGGFPGYLNFLKAVSNPKHPEHEELLEWIGGQWDPEAFDLYAVNKRLQPRKRKVAKMPTK